MAALQRVCHPWDGDESHFKCEVMSLREVMARKRVVYSTYVKHTQLAQRAHNLTK